MLQGHHKDKHHDLQIEPWFIAQVKLRFMQLVFQVVLCIYIACILGKCRTHISIQSSCQRCKHKNSCSFIRFGIGTHYVMYYCAAGVSAMHQCIYLLEETSLNQPGLEHFKCGCLGLQLSIRQLGALLPYYWRNMREYMTLEGFRQILVPA